MNQELTQRIIGAVVVTALAAIFIPMLFDDPAVDSGQLENPLEIPEQHFPMTDAPDLNVPETVAEVAPLTENNTLAPALDDQEMQAEPPTDIAIDEEAEFAPVIQESPKPTARKTVPETTHPQPKKSPQVADHAVKTDSSEQPAAKSSVPKSTRPHPDLKRYYLQAGSFSKQENAQSLANKLKQQGLPVFMETIKTPGKGTLYRLRIGPELDKSRAQAMQKKLTQQNIESLLLTE